VFDTRYERVLSSHARTTVALIALLFVAVLATLAPVDTARGAIIAELQPVQGVPDLLRDSNTYTIQEIIDSGGIVIGDKLFDLFAVRTTKSVNAAAPGAGEIGITPIQILKPGAPLGGDFGMIFNGPWSAPANQFADSTIEFRASILPEWVDAGYAFKDNSLWITAFGVGNNTDAGQVSVSENLYKNHPSAGEAPFSNKYAYYVSDDDQQLRDDQDFEPITQMWVIKDVVAYGGLGTVGSVHLSEFYQTFSQVPEPNALVLLTSAGLCGLIALRRRRK